jgi:uncharacterized protein
MVVSNSTPLIALSSIGKIDVLKKTFQTIIIPEAVYNEVVVQGKGKIGSEAIQEACTDWISIQKVKNRDVVSVLNTVLDIGESEVIALSQEINASVVLLDNREPRRFAKKINLSVLGTLGIIKMAWMKGIIQKPVELVLELRVKGFWLSDALLQEYIADIERD